MTEALHDSLIDLLVQQLDSTLSAATMVDWATSALCEDLDTPALVILAGLPRASSRFEAEPWLASALAELGVEPPPPDVLRRAYVGVVSRAVLAGTTTIAHALDLIHSRAVSPLGHPSDLQPWCFVWEGLAPSDYHSLDAVGIEHEARTLASVWSQQATIVPLSTKDAGA
jgi:hypothetical protein